MTIPVILDVDTGVDDALALLLAARSPALQLLGVTCVNGNVDLESVCRNTLQVLEAAGRNDVPVARGSAAPLQEKPVGASHVHGRDGLANLSGSLPTPAQTLEAMEAVPFLASMLSSAPQPVTLVPLGPLTNIALFLQAHADLTANIAQIVLMGGAVGPGNASAVSEFNIRQDPEAAALVLGSGLDIVMYTWDVFTQVVCSPEQIRHLAAHADPAPRLAGRILQYSLDTLGREHVLIGDAGAVASVISPEALTTSRWPVKVELQGTYTRGMTVLDQRPQSWVERESEWQEPWPDRVAAATAVNADALLTIFLDAVMDGGQMRGAP